MAYEDRPMKWDNWDIDVYYQKKPYAADTVSDVKLLEDGPVRRTLEIQKQFVDSVVTQRVHLYHDLPRIDFETHADWKEPCAQSFLTCGADNCFVEVIKRAEDGNGFILRMYENKNRFTKTELLFGRKISNLYECNLMEVNEREIPLLGQAAEITFRPYEIKTFRMVFESI